MMFEILEKRTINENVKLMKINAPLIAKKAKAGQFIILRVDEHGERIPLTIAEHDGDRGTVTIIFQEVGKTTKMLGLLEESDSILDFAGPLGEATKYPENIKRAVVVGGGLGTAIAYPQARALKDLGVDVDVITGFKNKEFIILEEEMKNLARGFYLATDDGSKGIKGFVTQVLEDLIDRGNKYDLAIAMGPLIMMKFVCEITKKHGIKTIVSMNPVMVDGTGMCGGCRVTVGGETKFACVDGPDFDGHLVDFDEAIRRQGMYKKQESESNHLYRCRLEDM